MPRRSWPLVVALGLVPFALIWGGTRVLLPRIGNAVARAALTWAATARPDPEGRQRSPIASSPVIEEGVTPEPIVARPAPLPSPTSSPKKKTARSVRLGCPGRLRSCGNSSDLGGARLLIAADRLAALTANQLRAVRWANVTDAQGGVRGVRLFGVSALGLGLLDGDVVTSINGRPTRTDEEAVSAGAAGWSSGAPFVEALIARGNKALSVTLHLPAR